MEKLVEILLEETVILKDNFINKTKEFAKNRYSLAISRKKWKEVDWCKYYNLEPRPVNAGTHMEFLTFPSGFYNTSLSKDYRKMTNEIWKICSITEEKYIESEAYHAELHYISSIRKLSDRIIKMGLDISKISLETTSIGININTIITDGNKTVRAYTIVAEGEIQRPHYRYLIK